MSNFKDIFYIYHPVFVLTKYTGFSAFSIENSLRSRQINPCQRYTIVTNLSQIMVVFALIWSYFGVFIKYEMSSLIWFLALFVAVIMNCIHYFIHVIVKNLFRKDIIKIFDDLDCLDKDFNRLGIKLAYTRLKIFTLSIIAICGIINIWRATFILCTAFGNGIQSFTQTLWQISRVYVEISHTVFDATFFCTLLIIKCMFSNLNAHLIEKFLRNNETTDTDVTCCRTLSKHYQSLISILERFSKIMSPQLLLVIAVHFDYAATQLVIFVQYVANIGWNLTFLVRFVTTCAPAMIKMAILIGVPNECQIKVRQSLVAPSLSFCFIIV